MNLEDAQERSATAGEFVLGTLDAQERASFEQALKSDAALQADVYAWQDRLLGLAARVPAAMPDTQLWPRIDARVGSSAAAAARPASENQAPAATSRESGGGMAANDPLWKRLRLWQAASGFALAACLVMATLLVQRMPAAPQGDRYLALLEAPDKSVGWIVESAPGGAVRLVPVGNTAAAPAGKTLQFWTKPEGAAGPTSLGLVRAGQTVEVPASQLPGMSDKQLFELTLEPEGGSPLPRPTGPILFIGRAVRV